MHFNLEANNNTHTDKEYSEDNIAHQNLANSDAIDVEVARLWEDGHCSINQ